jgi:hypothetical protein
MISWFIIAFYQKRCNNKGKMKKARILPVMALFSVMLASCPDLSSNSKENPEETFWAQNTASGTFYTVNAERLYEGKQCEIWADKEVGVTKAMAENIAREYDNKIRPCVVNTFSKKNFTYNNSFYRFADMLDFANAIAGRTNRKLTILLLDIKDNYNPTTNRSYVGGYFYPLDLYEKGSYPSGGKIYYSNGRDMIYVDTYPGLEEQPEQTYSTFAHELQHLVNFATVVQIQRGNITPDNKLELLLTDTWIDEGLSTYAEYLYLGKHSASRCEWLSDNRNNVDKGNNFYMWGNHDEYPYALLDDYATAYLFFYWLYLHAGKQSHIFYDIITSSSYDFHAVTSVAAQIDNTWGNWETLLRTWLAANYYSDNTVYGYIGDPYLQKGQGSANPDFKGIKVEPFTGSSTVPLYPGEGVYSIISGSSNPAASGTHIRYAGLAAGNSNITTTAPYSGTLLTFNANTNNSSTALFETGHLASVSPSPTASRTAAENARQAGESDGPYVIDAQDMLGRDRFKYRLPR